MDGMGGRRVGKCASLAFYAPASSNRRGSQGRHLMPHQHKAKVDFLDFLLHQVDILVLGTELVENRKHCNQNNYWFKPQNISENDRAKFKIENSVAIIICVDTFAYIWGAIFT